MQYRLFISPLNFSQMAYYSTLKPQTHGEREARSQKNVCAQQSDITISLTLLTTYKTCKSSKLGKIASSRQREAFLASETCIHMENRFTLHASRLTCVCSKKACFSKSLLVQGCIYAKFLKANFVRAYVFTFYSPMRNILLRLRYVSFS